jgi:type II secretory pathway predicted ATPase ExeA
LEHLHHFGLAEDPFRADTNEKFDVELPSQQDALARVDRGVRQGRGLIVLVGSAGTGKTRVARRLFEELEEEQFEAAMMVVLRREVGAEWLLPRIARQLGVENADVEREAVRPSSDRDTVIRQIYERLAIIHEDGRRAVVIIDDAHGLANADTLSELCGLVKLEYEERRLLTVVLVGSPQLDAAIAADPLVRHQVDVRVQLAPLDREETAGYLAARSLAAGGGSDLLLAGASAALHEFAEGAPGRINRLADNALYEAWLAGRSQVTRSDVELAHRHLGWAAPAAQPLLRPAPAEADLTDPIALGARAISDTADRESGLDAAAEPPPRRTRGGRGSAERKRSQAEEREGPPKGDDVDDLFMELLDD